MTTTSGHVVLLGDSIFDNQTYTQGEPDVVTHLRSLLPSTWRATLRAIDGATTADVSRQFAEIPADATHLVLSLGGNDALMNSDLLGTSLKSSAEALRLFGERLDSFDEAYRRALGLLVERQRRLTVCTIYNGALEPDQARLARVALMMFNDVIVRAAVDCGAAVIELRSICTERTEVAVFLDIAGNRWDLVGPRAAERSDV
jgi:hypothetical protein